MKDNFKNKKINFLDIPSQNEWSRQNISIQKCKDTLVAI